ncbi:MAG: beta-L-arabinofuranosidase domain-containing protein [Verrucomicrobiia bacterium]
MTTQKPLLLLAIGLFVADVPHPIAAAPAGATTDSPYFVTVEGRPVAIYQAHTWEPGYVPSYGGPYWFCSFDLSGPVRVEVSTTRPLDKLQVQPKSRGMSVEVQFTNAVLQVTRPGQIVFEPDGKNGPLLLFANPPEAAPPDKDDPNVRYFGAGLHQADAIQLTNNQTLYLAPGAVVQGGIHARGTNITIRGRGILDGYAYPRFKGPTRYPVLLENCRDVTVEGIVIKDGWSWTFVPGGCDRVRIENVKLLSARVENGDGFDIVNSRNVTIANCFVRSDDDCVTPKGMGARWQGFYGNSGAGASTAPPAQGMPVENLRVENCILWSDRAHIWRIGCESQAEAFRNFVFRNIDVVHFPDLWTPDEVPFCISLEPSEDMVQENILFEDIRVRTDGQRGLIDVRPKVTQWARQPVPGRVQNVIFRNVSFTGPAEKPPGRVRVSGPGPAHSAANVRFENVTRNGETLTAASPGVEVLGFVDAITFTSTSAGKPASESAPAAETRRHAPIVLIEARQARGLIAVPGGADGPFKAAVARLQEGLKRATGTTLPVVEEAKPGPAIILGDSPQAEAERLKTKEIPAGGFELRTLKERVLIVGDPTGVLNGVEAFLTNALHYIPASSTETGTDFVAPPLSVKHEVVMKPRKRVPEGSEQEPLRFADFQKVTVADSFWQPILGRNRAVTLPHILRMCREVGVVANFERVAGLRDGDYHGLPNWDEFLYKTIEAASYGLIQQPDPALDGDLDDLIAVLTRAQDPDGYLRTVIQLSERGRGPKGLRRWENLTDNLELYCAGHLIEAGVAHFRATGKRTLLDVALRNATLIDRLFGTGRRIDVGGHEEIELALVRLSEATGDERWWRLAKFFVDTRGTEAGGRRRRGEFSQDHAPLFDQLEAVGQAPRATYLYSGAADVGRLSRDPRYHTALVRLWDDVVTRKFYLNGGIGSRHDNEGFGPAYDLPSRTAYTEICAAVSFPMWATRMFRVESNAAYFDVIERTLYNNMAAGVSLSGDRYFYACPLASDGTFKFNLGWAPAERERLPHADASATRKEWFPCACCPPTLARYLPQIPGFAYAIRRNDLFVNLFIAGEAEVYLGNATWRLTQEGSYPWDGRVKLRLKSGTAYPKSDMTVWVRIPGWSRNQPVPGNLYRFADAAPPSPALSVNGRLIELSGVLTNGFARLNREWASGDTIELDLPMPVRRVVAHPNVKDCVGKVALQRGPIVYCFEGADHGGHVLDLSLPAGAVFLPLRRDDLLGGTWALQGSLSCKGQPVPATAIPYHLWSNRGPGEMVVWLDTSP